MDGQDTDVCAFCHRAYSEICGHLVRFNGKLVISTNSDSNSVSVSNNIPAFAAHKKCMQYSSNLVQYTTGQNTSANYVDGFLMQEVWTEVLRGRKNPCNCHVCSKYSTLNKKGATAGCAWKKCKLSFHYPCAVESAEARVKRLKEIQSSEIYYSVYCSTQHMEMCKAKTPNLTESNYSSDEEDYNNNTVKHNASTSLVTEKKRRRKSDESSVTTKRRKSSFIDEEENKIVTSSAAVQDDVTSSVHNDDTFDESDDIFQTSIYSKREQTQAAEPEKKKKKKMKKKKKKSHVSSSQPPQSHTSSSSEGQSSADEFIDTPGPSSRHPSHVSHKLRLSLSQRTKCRLSQSSASQNITQDSGKGTPAANKNENTVKKTPTARKSTSKQAKLGPKISTFKRINQLFNTSTDSSPQHNISAKSDNTEKLPEIKLDEVEETAPVDDHGKASIDDLDSADDAGTSAPETPASASNIPSPPTNALDVPSPQAGSPCNSAKSMITLVTEDEITEDRLVDLLRNDIQGMNEDNTMLWRSQSNDMILSSFHMMHLILQISHLYREKKLEDLVDLLHKANEETYMQVSEFNKNFVFCSCKTMKKTLISKTIVNLENAEKSRGGAITNCRLLTIYGGDLFGEAGFNVMMMTTTAYEVDMASKITVRPTPVPYDPDDQAQKDDAEKLREQREIECLTLYNWLLRHAEPLQQIHRLPTDRILRNENKDAVSSSVVSKFSPNQTDSQGDVALAFLEPVKPKLVIFPAYCQELVNSVISTAGDSEVVAVIDLFGQYEGEEVKVQDLLPNIAGMKCYTMLEPTTSQVSVIVVHLMPSY